MPHSTETNDEAPPILRARDLKFRYGESGFQFSIAQLDLSLGETLAIVGPSGSGKTTLLLLLAGIHLPDAGSIQVQGTEITQLTERERRLFRSYELGFVFQDFQLLDYLNVRDNLRLPFYLRTEPLRTEDETAADRLMESLGLAGLEQRRIDQLSQGERQRVATCRALVTRPRIILADEPTGNLDPRNKLQTMQRLQQHAAQRNSALVVVTHDVNLLDGFDHVLDLSEVSESGQAASRSGRREATSATAADPTRVRRHSHFASVRHAFLLARRYLAHHRLRAWILIACLSLSLYMPLANRWVAVRFASELTARAETTPVVVGASGNRFDLVLHALYFDPPLPQHLTMAAVTQIEQTEYGRAIPLFLAHTARGAPVVGTTLDYFEFRGLQLEQGAPMVRLGDCLVGSEVARRHGLEPGDRLLTDPENVFDLAGAYPLSMRIRGILQASGSRDDEAVFCDIKTAWLIQGIGHGHQDLAEVAEAGEGGQAQDSETPLRLPSENGTIVASAAVAPYLEVTEENLRTFHFHGDPSTFPVTAILGVPPNQRALDLLLGRYVGHERTQALIPEAVVGQLVAMVFRVKRLVDVATWMVFVVTGLFLLLVLVLTLSLRRSEMQTMYKLGCSRFMMVRLQAIELILLLVLSSVIAGSLAWATSLLAPAFLHRLLPY